VRKLFYFCLFIFAFLFFVPKTNATEPNCWCTGENKEECTRYSDSCPAGDAQEYEGFSICCNEPNLYNSVFALKSPICGSSLEKPIIGCEAGTFADGNTMLFCVGNEFRRGQTDTIFDGKDNVNFDPGGSFTYNGNAYSSGNVYVCNSGASCCAQGGAGFKCEDIYKPNPSTLPPLDDNNDLPNDERADLCGLTGEPDDDLVRYVHTNTDEYELTCADVPVVDVIRQTCSEDAGGYGAPYGKVTQFDKNNNNQEYIDVQALVSLAGAKLGGYGPDATAQRNNSLDTLAKVYPYNALLNSPLKPNAPREASGTFWRLINQLEQMNAKAKLMLRYKQQTPPMRDQDIVYAGNEAAQEGDADGRALANYMNAIIAGVGANSKIKLLSPAFNLTSHFTPPLIAEMLSAGANFSALAGCAGNTYTVAGQGAHSWYQSFLAQTGLSGKCNFVFTEFGDFDTFGKPLDGRPDVIDRMKAEFDKTIADGSVLGALYFNAMGGNDEFDGHQLSQTEYLTITGSNRAKAGVNSARSFDGGTFQDAAASYAQGGWTLEIAFSPGDEGTVVNSINRALSRGLTPIIRICVGTTCDFTDPKAYIEFLQRVASQTSGAFYAIAGPNEPEREQWVGTTPGEVPAPPPKTTSLSSLMNRLPSCLTSFPVCNDAVSVYAALDPDTRIKYDALIPFNQDNLRGYLALRYIEPVDKQTDVGILTEGLPYIESIKEALNDPSFGIINALSPGWLNAARSRQSTSENYITPDQEKNNRGVIERVADKAKQIWAGDLKEDDPLTYPPGCYLHKKGTTLPAPTTYPRDFNINEAKPEWQVNSEPFPKSLYQFLRVPVKTTETQNSDKCIIKDKFGREIGRGTHYATTVIKTDPNNSGTTRGDGYLTSDIGRSIAVLNNPKMTDISRLISEPKNDTNYSLNAMILPAFAKQTTPYVNNPLLAPGASYDSTIYYYTDAATQDSAQAGGSQSTAGLIARKGGQAHTDLCVLRNFWLRPSGSQLGKPEDCEILDSYINTTSSTSPYVADTTRKNPDGKCTLPTASFDTTLRATIQKMHNNPNSNASKVPLEFLFSVYEIESLPYFTGRQEYVCQENSDTAAGPFQIIKSTYNLLTCDTERMANDISVCKADSGKLSRCDIENNVELAARVILFSAGKWLYGPGNCSATNPISPTDKATIYKAANNYYGSCTPDAYTSPYRLQIPRPNSERPNYGDIVLEKMGLIKTAADYPQPQCQ